MKTIHGVSIAPGVAIAVGAVVDSIHGLNLVSPVLLQEGLKALKAMLPVQDYPEAIIVCDVLNVGASLRVPGVNTIGIAAESLVPSDGVQVSAPCVIGLPDLLKSVREGDIIIVDGGKGLVHVDPDLETIIHYQRMQELATPRNVIYITAEHLPAKTATGETVLVYALVQSRSDLDEAVDQGADGLVVDSKYCEFGSYEDFAEILQLAAGKQIVFLAVDSPTDILRAAMHFAAPNQVSVVFSCDLYHQGFQHIQSALELTRAEALFENLTPPAVHFGIYAEVDELHCVQLLREAELAVVDVYQSLRISEDRPPLGQLALWLEHSLSSHVIVLLGPLIDQLPSVFDLGARSVAVDPCAVSAAKALVRAIGIDSGDFS